MMVAIMLIYLKELEHLFVEKKLPLSHPLKAIVDSQGYDLHTLWKKVFGISQLW